MKKMAFLLLGLLFLSPAAVDAKGKKKQAAQKQNYDINYANFTGYNDNGSDEAARRAQIRNYDSTYSFVTRAQQHSGGASRTINEATEGILGRDEIRLNEKGEYRNLNTNTGVPLPANTGGSGR